MLDDELPLSAGYDTVTRRERALRVLWRYSKRVREQLRKPMPRQHVLIAGSQRSGTNMLMHVLQWSSYTHVFHESDPRAFERYEMRPTETIVALARHSKAPFFVIKSLCELDRLSELMDQLVPAKTLWCVRNYNDSVRSMTRSFGLFGEQVRRLSLDKAAAGWRGRGMSDATQSLLRRLYHPGLSEASAAALMWYYRNILFFEHGLDRDPRVGLVVYEDLVRQPVIEGERIFEFLGLPGWSPWITRKIHSHSVKDHPCEDIGPDVRALCEALLARFQAARSA